MALKTFNVNFKVMTDKDVDNDALTEKLTAYICGIENLNLDGFDITICQDYDGEKEIKIIKL